MVFGQFDTRAIFWLGGFHQVVGMRHKNHNAFPVKLGGGVYDIDGSAIQTFPIT